MMYMCRKGKEEYSTGEKKEPPKNDPKHRTRKFENNMIMTWLINSMEKEIRQDFMFYKTVTDIWDTTKKTYSDSENTSKLFELDTILRDLKQ